MDCLLKSSNLTLSLPQTEDMNALQNFNKRNRQHLKPWESTDTPQEPSVEANLSKWKQECDDGTSFRLLIRKKKNPDQIIGLCNFTQIFYGPFRACYLGYKIDNEHEGKGLMFEALQASIKYVFEVLELHRIMANYMPSNLRSARLLHRLGFVIEGYAKSYLLINGKWEDHVLSSLSADSWKANLASEQFLKKQKAIPFPVSHQNMTPVLREAEAADAPRLANLMTQLGYPIEENAMRKNLQEYNLSPNQKAWVAENEGAVVGCIAVSTTNCFHRNGSFLRIITLIVDQYSRRTGIGTLLLQTAEKYALNHGCSHIELTSAAHRELQGSHQFYRSQGYIELNPMKKYFAKKLF